MLHHAVRTITAAVLDDKDGALKAFSELGKELFPERVVREKEFDSKSQSILERMGDTPIPVAPITPAGSPWGNRCRSVKVGLGPKKDA